MRGGLGDPEAGSCMTRSSTNIQTSFHIFRLDEKGNGSVIESNRLSRQPNHTVTRSNTVIVYTLFPFRAARNLPNDGKRLPMMDERGGVYVPGFGRRGVVDCNYNYNYNSRKYKLWSMIQLIKYAIST